MSKHVRIQVSGPFAELDFTVPEKKAPAELRKIKKIAAAYIAPVKEKAKQHTRYKAWAGHPRGYVWRTRRIEFEAAAHDIQPTTITITTV